MDALARWRHRYRNISSETTHETYDAYKSNEDLQFISRASVETIETLQLVAGNFERADRGGSRSGASFFKTKCGTFFLKGFDRLSEFVEMVKFRKEFRQVPGIGTTFVEPLLAFPAFGNYWVITANVEFVFSHLVGNGFLEDKTFDVKPEPLISESRKAFLRHLVEVGFQPGPSERLTTFNIALENDLGFLERHQMCDWSWFIKYYKVEPEFAEQVEAAGANLPWATVGDGQRPWCFAAAREGTLLCFAILDYSLNFETLSWIKRAESKALRDKWKNYTGKFRDFNNCIFNMRPSERELHKMLGLAEQPEGFLAIAKAQQDIEEKFVYRVRVKPRAVDPAVSKIVGGAGDLTKGYRHTTCYVYYKDACQHLFHGDVIKMADGCIFHLNPEAYKKGDAMDSHDEFWLKEALAQKGDYCLGYMVEKCHKMHVDLQKTQVVGEKMMNFNMFRNH